MFPSSLPLLAAADQTAFVENPAGVLAVLLGILAGIFWLAQHSACQRFFRIIPMLVLCYFVPTTLTTLGILPAESPLYTWIKTFILPASLLLLILSLDVPGILRLGPKPVIMLLAGTASVVIGGPIALLVGQRILTVEPWRLPPDTWQGLAALSGSWIGGGANYLAIGDIVGASGHMIAMMVIPDVLLANIWMGVLLYLSNHQHAIDARIGADARMIRDLEARLTAFQQRVARIPTLADLIIILALGFGASWVCYKAGALIDTGASSYATRIAGTLGITHVAPAPGAELVPLDDPAVKSPYVGGAIDRVLRADPTALDHLSFGQRLRYHWSRFVNEKTGAGMWKYVLVTTLGLVLSFTRVRNLEGAGASKLGSVMLYLLVATIGATADFTRMREAPGLIVVGFIWMAVHVTMLLIVGRLIRAPIFFIAVGSQANIGGAASAPIVAAAYHPALAPVGVLLAVAGYVLGTYAGLLCAAMLKWVAGAA